MRRSGAEEGGLEVAGDTDALDAYTIALGQAGIALRSLERRTRSLESLFLELTGDRQGIAPVTSAAAAAVEGLPSRSLA